jgi:queuosine precursor transporter
VHHQFKLILHNQTRMFIASGIAFFLGMTINSTAISILKARQRNRGISLKKEFITTVWTRIATSSAFGIMIDVSIFSLIAFYDIVPNEKLGSVIFFEDIYKISYEVLLAPVSILLIYLLKIKEKVDTYDERSNLNPFKIETNYKFSANRFDENYTKLKEHDNG